MCSGNVRDNSWHSFGESLYFLSKVRRVNLNVAETIGRSVFFLKQLANIQVNENPFTYVHMLYKVKCSLEYENDCC